MIARQTPKTPFPYLAVLVAALFVCSVYLIAGCAQNDSTTADETDAATQVPASASDDPLVRGRASYDAYCASCHGPEGKGDGEVAADLATPPANLTQLAAKNNGTFPVDSVYQTIDGRADVEAHGPREMPVWGNIWSESGDEPIPQEVVEQRINELVEYIRSIQE